MNLLEVDNLQVDVAGQRILNGLSLVIPEGEVHALMGPNGSGKSTLANVLAGRPGYEVVSGSIKFRGDDLCALQAHERALAGVFLAFQYPVEIPGVSNMEFLKAAMDARAAAAVEASGKARQAPSTVAFMKSVREAATSLGLGAEFLKRGVNEGFSGGEKKRNEILQMLLLQPSLAVLDETDSGLDIDALQVVADGVNRFRSSSNSILLVTHYQRLLNYVKPDAVHVLAAGRIVRSGDASLALELEEKGYGWLTDAPDAHESAVGG